MIQIIFSAYPVTPFGNDPGYFYVQSDPLILIQIIFSIQSHLHSVIQIIFSVQSDPLAVIGVGLYCPIKFIGIDPGLLALLDYVSRAHEIEIRPSSVVRRPSIRPSVCGIDYLWSYCMDFFQILVVASPGPYAQTFFFFLRFWSLISCKRARPYIIMI